MSDDLGSLLKQLGDDNIGVRMTAADALGKMGEPAVESLCAALRDNEWIVREAAANALGSIGSAKAIDALCCALGDSDKTDPVGSVSVRNSAVHSLVRIGEAAVDQLLRTFENGCKEARWSAAIALGKIGAPRAVQPLCQALGDLDGDIRACAVCALADIGHPAVEPLCQMLRHSDWTVRACSANALAKIGDPRAVEPLREGLRRIDAPFRRFVSWAFEERIEFASGVRQTARDSEADAIRSALERFGDHRGLPGNE